MIFKEDFYGAYPFSAFLAEVRQSRVFNEITAMSEV